MKLRKNRKVAVVVSTMLAAVIALSATFAWITSSDSRKNHFESSKYMQNIVVSEKFGSGDPDDPDNPDNPDNWRPGNKVTKNVAVYNTGDANVLVRVSFEEMVQKLTNMDGATWEKDTPNTTSTTNRIDLSAATTTKIPAKVDISTFTDWTPITVNGGAPGLIVKKAPTPDVNGGDGLVAYIPYYWEIPANTTTGAAAKTGMDYQAVKLVGDDGEKWYTVTRNASNEITGITITRADYAYYEKGTVTSKDWKAATSPSAQTGTEWISTVDDQIQLIFDGALKADMSPSSWYYNANDGYFYYMGTVESGDATAMLLDSVKLLGTAGMDYSWLNYDLTVNAEGIQNLEEALGATGWKLDTSNLNLYNALKTYCEAVQP